MADELNSLLEQLADKTRPVRSINLTHISDLSRSEVGRFRAVWDSFSLERRLELISVMVEQAETNIHLNFHAILRSCLADDDARIRRLAIEGLWEDERVSLVQPLTMLLVSDPAFEVRAAAATSLARFVLMGVLGEIAESSAAAAEEALRTVWYRAGEPVEVRRRALEGLAYSNSPMVHDLIHSAYYHEDELMRQSAVFAMGCSADPRWSRLVLAELDSQEPAMRFEAAVAAGEMGLRNAVPALIHRLDDSDGNVREAAALALGKIGGPAARRALQELLKSDEARLAEAAEEALDELTFNSDQMDDVPLDYPGKPGKAADRRSRAVISDDDLSDDADENDLDADDLDWDDDVDDGFDDEEVAMDEDESGWDDEDAEEDDWDADERQRDWE